MWFIYLMYLLQNNSICSVLEKITRLISLFLPRLLVAHTPIDLMLLSRWYKIGHVVFFFKHVFKEKTHDLFYITLVVVYTYVIYYVPWILLDFSNSVVTTKTSIMWVWSFSFRTTSSVYLLFCSYKTTLQKKGYLLFK